MARRTAEVDLTKVKPLTEPHVVCRDCGLHRNKAYAERGAPCSACGLVYVKPEPKKRAPKLPKPAPVEAAPVEAAPVEAAPKQPTQRQQKAEAQATLAAMFRSVK